MKYSSKISLLACAIAAFGAGYLGNASAASLTWDPSHTGTGSDGDGIWDNAASNWSNGTSDTTFTSVTDSALFGSGGTAGTVTVTGSQTAATMTINSGTTGNYTFTGDPLTVSGAFAVNQSATFNNSLTLGGVGGATVVASGQTLTIAGGGAVGASSSGIPLSGAGTVAFTGGSFNYQGNKIITTANVSLTGTAALTSGGVFAIGSTDFTINSSTATLSNSFNLNIGQGGTSTLTLTAGTITSTSNDVAAIAVSSGSTGTFNVQGGTVNVTNGGTSAITINKNTTGTSTLNISGGTVNTNGIIFGSGVNVGTANLAVTGGTLYVGANGISKSGSATSLTTSIALSGGIVGARGTWSSSMNMTLGTTNGNVTFQAADALGSAFNISLSGALSGSGGLIKSGGGTLTLSGANTYTGSTSVTAGTLSITTGFLADGSDVLLTTGSIFDLNFSGSDTIKVLYIDGVAQAIGTWGAIGSAADHTSSLFTGTGTLTVTAVPEPTTEALLGAGITMSLFAFRRRRHEV